MLKSKRFGKDHLSALLLTALGGLAVALGVGYGLGTLNQMGAGFFPIDVPLRLFAARADRILYGTDFPNIPYAWDRELKHLTALKLPSHDEASLLGGNALRLFGVA